MSMRVPCDCSVYVQDFLCNCEGIAKFSEEAPFVWYKASETGYCLVWNITINSDVAERIQMASQKISLEPIFKNQPIEGIRSNVIDAIFQNNIKSGLIQLSTSDFLWNKFGKFSQDIYNRYFTNGVQIALRDISGEGLSWRKDCQEHEKYYASLNIL